MCQNKPCIAVIIVNYNAGSVLANCIQSLVDGQAAIEIIVVDNASNDGSLALIKDIDGVQIIQNTTNRGFAAACNQGVMVSHADSLLFLNPDCLVAPNALTELNHYLCTTPQVGMVGGWLVNLDGSEQAGGRRSVPTPWRSFVRAFGLNRLAPRWPKLFNDFNLHLQPLPTEPVEVEAISGACLMVRRNLLPEIGMWDEDYFLHCEDLDWCMRMRKAGWKILFVPSAKIIHAHGVCSRSRPIFVEWHKHRGMMRFYRKFFRHQYPWGLMWLVWLSVWLRFGVIVVHYGIQHLKRRLGLAP